MKLISALVLLSLSMSLFAQEFSEKDIESGYIACLDNKIYYEEAGNGEPLILAHAGFLDVQMWDDQFLFFANNGFRVIRFDSYAHGKTIDGKNAPYLHELVKVIVDSLSLGKVNLAGVSMGGVTLIDFALEHPDDIDKMVLVGTGINGFNWTSDTLFLPNLKKQIEYRKNLDTVNTVEMFLRSWTDGPYREPEEIPVEVREKNRQIIHERFRVHGLSKNALNRHPKAIRKYKEINVPTLILVGDQDMPSIHMISNMLVNGIDGSQLKEIKGVGHMMNMEIPELFNEIVLEFLK